jgi:hypothetical protein
MKIMEHKIKEFKALLGQMSYFNAAEKNWFNEVDKRKECRIKLQNASKELKTLGLSQDEISNIVEKGQYLVCKLDYIVKE